MSSQSQTNTHHTAKNNQKLYKGNYMSTYHTTDDSRLAKPTKRNNYNSKKYRTTLDSVNSLNDPQQAKNGHSYARRPYATQ
jgi:DNA topoisomerase IA